jgi:hypothetical protein
MLACPFCGRPETERLVIEGRMAIIFPCMFTPTVDPHLTEAELQLLLHDKYGAQGGEWFEHKCEELHLWVMKERFTHKPAPGPVAPPREG